MLSFLFDGFSCDTSDATSNDTQQEVFNSVMRNCYENIESRIKDDREQEMQLTKYRYAVTERPRKTCERFFNYKDCTIEVFDNESVFRVLAPDYSAEEDSKGRGRFKRNHAELIDMGIEFHRLGDAFNFVETLQD